MFGFNGTSVRHQNIVAQKDIHTVTQFVLGMGNGYPLLLTMDRGDSKFIVSIFP